MKQLPVTVMYEDDYYVTVEWGSVQRLCNLVQQVVPKSHECFLLTDDNVGRLHLALIAQSFREQRVRLEVITVPAGEASKSLETYSHVINQLVQLGMKRRSVLLLFGGGVIMDMGGFVGASFMRGVPVINVPTSLVGQIDAAIGGKVAVNHPLAKNLIGAFYNPRAVIVDPSLLLTLQAQELREGLAEMIKTAIIGNPSLFNLIEQNLDAIFAGDREILTQLVVEAIGTKIELLRPDPRERDLARALNFGHTLAHPLETCARYEQLTHGEAVAIGMCAATRLAEQEGMCSTETAYRILQLIERAGLPTCPPPQMDQSRLEEAIAVVQRIRNGKTNYVVPVQIGHVQIIDMVPVARLMHYLFHGSAVIAVSDRTS